MDLKKMRVNITELIDDIKYQSDSLSDLDRLPVIQLNVLLAKIYKLTEKTTILHHYVEMQDDEQRLDRSKQIDKKDSSPNSDELIEVVNGKEDATIESPVEEAETNSQSSNVEDKLKSVMVKDLFAAIGINEKYLFASELFNGNIEEFTASVKAINELENLEQATAFMKELSSMYNWDIENESAIEFLELVERRFSQA